MLPSPFQSFFLGGFECATHRRRDGARLDVLATTHHDRRAAEDYRLLAASGIRTVRDGLRWHLIETSPGVYDWSSLSLQLDAALATGTQVLWDLCHWGVPDGLDPFSDAFAPRFAAFARAAAEFLEQRYTAAGVRSPLFLCPINEISFWAWVGGDQEHFAPFGKDRGPELKRHLVLASIAAIRAIRAVVPGVRFLQPEPLIRIFANPDLPDEAAAALAHSAAQFQAWDMIAGRAEPALGGAEDLLDTLGVNFYWNNEWIHRGELVPPGHLLHQPLHALLFDLWQRYHRPILISETGTEAADAIGWLGYIAAEVREARRNGVPVLGICLYPATDYPGWDDDRHCPCGPLALDDTYTTRTLRAGVQAELRLQAGLFDAAAASPPLAPPSLE